MNKMLNKFLPLFLTCFSLTLFAQTEVMLDTEITITTTPSNCVGEGVVDCSNLMTEYAITNLDDLDAEGARVVGVSASSTFSLGDFVSEGGNYAVTPVCYNLHAIRVLVQAIENEPDNLCCTAINTLTGGACSIIDETFPDSNAVNNFSDILVLVELLGTDSPSLETFISSITFINSIIGSVGIVCSGAIPFDYCMNLEEQSVYYVPGASTENAFAAGIEKFKLQPNPANDFFTIEIESRQNGVAVFEIIDFTGKSVLQENLVLQNGRNTFSSDISGLPAGIYFTVLKKDGKLLTAKLIKE